MKIPQLLKLLADLVADLGISPMPRLEVTASHFADSGARGDLDLCGLCTLWGELRRSFTTEVKESTEKIRSERREAP
jgi:hypothetical protein